jgi:hypothetical protein
LDVNDEWNLILIGIYGRILLIPGELSYKQPADHAAMISPLRLRYELLPMNQIGYYGCTTWALLCPRLTYFLGTGHETLRGPKHGESRGLRMVLDSSRPKSISNYLIGGFNAPEKY